MPRPTFARGTRRNKLGTTRLPQFPLEQVRSSERAEEISSGEQDADALSISDGDENIVGGECKRSAQKCSHRSPSMNDSAQNPSLTWVTGFRLADNVLNLVEVTDLVEFSGRKLSSISDRISA